MKQLLFALCLFLGVTAASASTSSSITSETSVPTAQKKRSETPDKIIVVMNPDGTIKEIIVIKKR